MPVPYNVSFELSIMAKLSDDALQILEQIVPYFQPSFNITVNLISSIGEKKDIPIVLESINYSDQYEGGFDSRRILIYTLSFTAKTYLFGPVGSNAAASKDLIKSAKIGYVVGGTTKTPTRDVTYSVVPRATKAYDNDVTTNLSEDMGVEGTLMEVNDSSGIELNTYVIVDSESIYVDKKSGNKLVVKRGQDGTTPTAHVSGAAVNKVTATTNSLIEIGDDFGFDGSFI